MSLQEFSWNGSFETRGLGSARMKLAEAISTKPNLGKRSSVRIQTLEIIESRN